MSRKQPELAKALRLTDDSFSDDHAQGQGEGMLHMRDIAERLLARWHWIALGLMLGLGLGFYQVWRAVPEYQARATVLVRDYNVSALGQNDAAEFDLRNQAAIETVRAGFLTFELAEAVASDPNVRELKGLVPPEPRALPFFSTGPSEDEAAEAPPAPRLAGMIQGWLSIKVRPGTRLIDIGVRHPKPVVAQTVANRLTEHYMKSRTESRAGKQGDTLDYLVAESTRVKEELQEAQNVLASYSAPLEAERELAAAETEVQALSLRYRHKHPKMIGAQARLKQAQERLREFLVRAIKNPVDGSYWSGLQESMGNLDTPEAVNKIRDRLISRRSVLESEIASQNSLYGVLLTQIETRQVTTKQTDAEVTPQESARLPGRPVYPVKSRMILQASALGLFAGVGLAFLFHFLDNKYHTVMEVESHLNLPVLAAMVAFDEETLEHQEQKKLKSGGSMEGREDWSPNMVFRVEGSYSHYAEMFRVLRTSISLLGPSEQRKVTMITSALPSEGKTLVTANLAVALAQQGLRTLLIDFDLRKPSTHKMFGRAKDDQPGIVDLLAGKAKLEEILITETGQKNLSLILSGPKAPNPGELLVSDRLEKLLNALRKHFDQIVLDTAPLLAVPDSSILAPLVDNLCLVVRAESTPRGPVRRAVDILEGFDVVPDGIVFNGYIERRRLMGKNYSYGYYRYGKYGYGKYGYGKYAYGKYGYGSTYGTVYGEEDDEEEEQERKQNQKRKEKKDLTAKK